MATKDEALDQILAIARSHELTSDDIKTALGDSNLWGEKRSTGLLGRILGFLGGTFLFAGLGVFIALNWDIMNTAARIIITLGSGIAALVLALIASGEERYDKAKAPLYLIAAMLQPTGILVAIDEFSTGGDWRHAALLTASIMVFQQGAVFWQKRDTTLLFTALLFALWFFGVALDLLDADSDFIAFLLGASAVLLCVGLEHTAHRSLTPFWYFTGSIAFFGGLFSLIQDALIEVIFVAVACGGVFLSTYVRSRTLLFVSTLVILGYIGYFTSKHFLDSLGWPFMLMMLGLLLIALGSVAMRINRRYIASK